MSLIDPALPPVHGLVDDDGRLVAADARLERLNAHAGGTIGGLLAVPQLATLARLARRLRILVSRAVTVADGDDDLNLWVRAEPDAGMVRLAITGWKREPAWAPATLSDERERDYTTSDADWTWECDAALRLTFLSEPAVVRHGIDARAMLGQPITRLFALITADDGGFPILAAVAGHHGFADQQAVLRGPERLVVVQGSVRLDPEARFAGFAGAVHMLEPAAVEAVGTGLPAAFGARLDKALRMPLGRIVANADSIHAQADGPLRPEYADYAADIATAGRHLMGLVDDLMDLQFIERDDFTVAREAVDLADVARRAAGLLAVRAEAQHVRIDRPPTGDAIPAVGEFRRALQVMVNLIGNAVRYSPDGGMVWIRIERDGDLAVVIVADQGKGIAEDDQARIFGKFERVDQSEPGGSGLGLYIARRLARAMGGDIAVDSAPGQGARFIFTLPAA